MRIGGNTLPNAAVSSKGRGARITDSVCDIAVLSALDICVRLHLCLFRSQKATAYFRISTTGGTPEPLGTSTHLASKAAAQGNCGYFGQDGITRSCAGSSPLFVAGSVDSLAADNSGVYFLGTGTGAAPAILKLPLDLSGTPAVLAPGAQGSIAVDGQFVYYIDGATGLGSCGTNWSINRVSKNGGNPTTIVVPPQACPQALAVDATSIYWLNFDSGELFKAAK